MVVVAGGGGVGAGIKALEQRQAAENEDVAGEGEAGVNGQSKEAVVAEVGVMVAAVVDGAVQGAEKEEGASTTTVAVAGAGVVAEARSGVGVVGVEEEAPAARTAMVLVGTQAEGAGGAALGAAEGAAERRLAGTMVRATTWTTSSWWRKAPGTMVPGTTIATTATTLGCTRSPAAPTPPTSRILVPSSRLLLLCCGVASQDAWV